MIKETGYLLIQANKLRHEGQTERWKDSTQVLPVCQLAYADKENTIPGYIVLFTGCVHGHNDLAESFIVHGCR